MGSSQEANTARIVGYQPEISYSI